MSILKSTHSGKQSNLTLEYLQANGYVLKSYWMVDFVVKNAQLEYDNIPDEFLACPLQYDSPNTKLMIAVKKRNGQFEYKFVLYLNIGNEGASGSYTFKLDTLEDFEVVNKYINTEMDYMYTSKIVTQLRKDRKKKLIEHFTPESSITSKSKSFFSMYCAPVNGFVLDI